MDFKRDFSGFFGTGMIGRVTNLFVPPVNAIKPARDELSKKQQAFHLNDNKKKTEAEDTPEENPAVIVTLGQKPAPRVTYDRPKPPPR